MTILKNRKFALLLSIVLMAVVLLLAVHVSGSRAARKVEALFYSGTNSAGSTNTVAIDDQLSVRADAAMGMVSVAVNYPELEQSAQTLRQARNDLLDASTIGEKYTANEALTSAAQKLTDEARSAGLSQRDADGFDGYVQRLSGAQTVIEQNTYNEKVQQFTDKVLDKFPLSVLKGIASVKSPEEFAG